MGDIDHYLGIKITRNRKVRSLTANMKHFIDKMLSTFGMSTCDVRSSL